MTPDQLYELGQKLGPGWQSKLARYLECTPRTVRYWLKGERKIGRLVAKEIRRIVQEHGV